MGGDLLVQSFLCGTGFLLKGLCNFFVLVLYLYIVMVVENSDSV